MKATVLDTFTELMKLILPTVLGVVLGILVNSARKHNNETAEIKQALKDETASNNKLTVALARIQIVNGYESYVVHHQPMSIERKKELEEVFLQYKSMGGNGTIAHMYEQIEDVEPYIISGEEGS